MEDHITHHIHPWKIILQVTFIHQSGFHSWKIILWVTFIRQSEFHPWKIILWVTFVHQSTFHPCNFILSLHIHRSDFILFTCVNSLLKKSSLSILRDSSFIIWIPFIHQSTFIHGSSFYCFTFMAHLSQFCFKEVILINSGTQVSSYGSHLSIRANFIHGTSSNCFTFIDQKTHFILCPFCYLEFIPSTLGFKIRLLGCIHPCKRISSMKVYLIVSHSSINIHFIQLGQFFVY